MVRIKVCGIQNEEELAIAEQCGVDAVGFQVGQLYPGRSFVLASTAGRLARRVSPWVVPFLVTHYNTSEQIYEELDRSEISNVQLPPLPLEELAALRDRLPGAAHIVLSVNSGHNLFECDYSEYYALVDAIMLNCLPKLQPGVSEQMLFERQPNWKFLDEFMTRCPLPVMVAGGLHAGNLPELFATAQPYGVDICSGVRDNNWLLEANRLAPAVKVAHEGHKNPVQVDLI